MRRALVLLLVALTVGCSSGTPTSPDGSPAASPVVVLPPENPGPGDHETAFLDSTGVVRKYLVHAPPSYTAGRTYPLVVVFHGSPMEASEMKTMAGMDPIADANNFLVVYPDQFSDATVVAALLDHLGPKWNVDSDRVHLAGFSRGGSFVYELALKMPQRFGSVAPVSAAGGTGQPLSSPLSLITFQGGRDSLNVTFNQTNARWDASAGCSGETVTPTTMQNSQTYVYASICKGGTEHVVYAVSAMAHQWPIEGSQTMWDFFAKHPRKPTS
jgi:polyhydroxybutyrate depolymerase